MTTGLCARCTILAIPVKNGFAHDHSRCAARRIASTFSFGVRTNRKADRRRVFLAVPKLMRRCRIKKGAAGLYATRVACNVSDVAESSWLWVRRARRRNDFSSSRHEGLRRVRLSALRIAWFSNDTNDGGFYEEVEQRLAVFRNCCSDSDIRNSYSAGARSDVG